MRAPGDLQVVVERTRWRRTPAVAITAIQTYGFVQVRPQQRRHERRRQNQQPAHRRRAGFGVVRLRPFLPDDLADLEVAQPADQPRAEEEADGQRRDDWPPRSGT